MGINTPSEIGAALQVGPTSEGMVRIYVRGEAIDLPLDFSPADAVEIAEELIAAARAVEAATPAARSQRAGRATRRRARSPRD